MSGIYRFYQGGELIGESKNLLTDNFSPVVLKYLSGQLSDWGGVIAVGSGAESAQATDKRLDFEFGRSNVSYRVADVGNSKVLLRTTLDASIQGEVHEIGVFASSAQADKEYLSRLITGFSPTNNVISNVTTNVDDVRVGTEASNINASASSSTIASLSQINLSFDDYVDIDDFTFAYALRDVNCASIEVRLKNSSTDYFSYTIDTSALAAGYHTAKWNRGDMIENGSINWEMSVTSIDIVVTADAGGATDVVADGFRIEIDELDDALALVSRSVLATPITMNKSQPLTVEYLVEVGVV